MARFIHPKEVDFSHIPEGKAIINQIHHNYKRGLLNIVKIIGLPGTGKSWLCLRLAELVSIRIHKENRIKIDNVVDSLLDLLRIVRRATEPGEIVIVEEAEVLFPSRRSMSGDNVDATKIFDTVRKKKMILLLNFPLNKSVDSRIEAMCNLEIETLKIYKKAGVCICKPMRLQVNPSSGKVYHHRLLCESKEVRRSVFNKPSEKLTKEYESKKDTFLNDLYKSLENRQEKRKLEAEISMGKQRQIRLTRPLTDQQLKVYDLRMRQGKSIQETADELGISTQAVDYHIKRVNIKAVPLQMSQKRGKMAKQQGGGI
jgi:DNA-binding CsgD family transcriptional regulator